MNSQLLFFDQAVEGEACRVPCSPVHCPGEWPDCGNDAIGFLKPGNSSIFVPDSPEGLPEFEPAHVHYVCVRHSSTGRPQVIPADPIGWQQLRYRRTLAPSGGAEDGQGDPVAAAVLGVTARWRQVIADNPPTQGSDIVAITEQAAANTMKMAADEIEKAVAEAQQARQLRPAPSGGAEDEDDDLADYQRDHMAEINEPRCLVCGCTDMFSCAEGCSWIVPGLCSNCLDYVESLSAPYRLDLAHRFEVTANQVAAILADRVRVTKPAPSAGAEDLVACDHCAGGVRIPPPPIAGGAEDEPWPDDREADPPYEHEEPGQDQDGFREWALLELMGHRRLAGMVSEQTIGGGAFILVDVPAVEGRSEAFTQFYSSSAVYAITPMTERMARSWIERNATAPMSRFEFTALEAPRSIPDDDDEGDQRLPY